MTSWMICRTHNSHQRGATRFRFRAPILPLVVLAWWRSAPRTSVLTGDVSAGDELQRRRVCVRAYHRIDVHAAVAPVFGPIGRVERVMICGWWFCKGDIASDTARPDSALRPLQDRAKPGAATSSVRADVQLIAEPDDPDRGEGAQRPIRAQRCDLQLVGGTDLGELVGSPVTHRLALHGSTRCRAATRRRLRTERAPRQPWTGSENIAISRSSMHMPQRREARRDGDQPTSAQAPAGSESERVRDQSVLGFSCRLKLPVKLPVFCLVSPRRPGKARAPCPAVSSPVTYLLIPHRRRCTCDRVGCWPR